MVIRKRVSKKVKNGYVYEVNFTYKTITEFHIDIGKAVLKPKKKHKSMRI